MKCCHLVAALVLAGCGLDTAALRENRSADAGIGASDTGGRDTIAGAPASWPARRRATPIHKDAGSGAAKDPSTKPPTAGKGGQANPSGTPNQGGAPANPGGSTNPGGQAPNPSGQSPSNSGKAGQAQAGGSTSQPSSGNPGASSQGSQSPVDAGASASADAGGSSSNSNAGSGKGNNPNQSGGSSNGGSSNGGPSNGGQGPSSGPGSNGGNPPPSTSSNQVGGAIDAIVNLVLAILDLSLGPIRPVEIEQLVSAILVLSLSPAELVADSLIAVLDALDDTRICRDHPERCNPLCTNLESDCSVCGHDDDCIERVEEMCHVQLPRRCH